MESNDNKNEMNLNNLETKKVGAPNRKNKKKIVATTAMFLGILVPIVAVIAIPLAVNSKANIKRSKFFPDDANKVELSETNNEAIFTQNSGNRIDIMSTNLGTINKMDNDSKSQEHGVRYKNELKFFSASPELNSIVSKILDRHDITNITETKSKIYSIDLKEIFDKYNEDRKSKVTTKEFFLSIKNLVTSISYYYYDNDSIHYFDQKEGYLGYLTAEFFKKIYKYLQENEMATFKIKEAKLEAFIELESDFKTIKSLNFENKVIIETEKVSVENK
ncbi:hypothetical protein [Mycoplasma phocoeninasale]|uniref:Uncharacterized protein n=1 Tax=Mycoplasma phocoeninasale TaxID=2726117 RepID=A0A858TZU5_9MOLU|nr:hypothetical protein [Mycoplasma phocoeninasale]MBN0970566.1 hypothetical protein [Mycoplasma phocoeninasale]QJG66314.1 hypothetical protein HGG64_01135 [Mycoplasma phocoeninasale]